MRPEKIRIAPVGASGAGDNVLRGTVVVASYLGTALQYLVRTASGAELIVMTQDVGEPGAAPGAEVELEWKPEPTFIV